MRQISAYFLIACIISCKGSSSAIDLDNESQVHSALIGKWESTFLENTAVRMKIPKEMVAVIIYNEDGTYDSRRKGGVIVNSGNWSYDPKTHRFNNSTNGTQYYQRVTRLTEKDMVLTNYTFSNEQIVDSTIETYKKM